MSILFVINKDVFMLTLLNIKLLIISDLTI